MFVGRENEMKLLLGLFQQAKPSLVVCRGRRRIGKSTLIQQFGRHADTFLEFQGLAPREGITQKQQLKAFSEQLARQTALPQLPLENWSQAFSLLSGILRDEKTIVFLDEVSWMSMGDKDFAGRLKIAWDTELKKHSKLVLVLCGSVSSWIEKNILNNTGFVGRISLEIKLEELPLSCCNRFFGPNRNRISSNEKFKLLSVTGGVPRYLEEINPTLSADENIKRSCFTRTGMLFNEFSHIFHDIFSKRAPIYRAIVQSLVDGRRDISSIAEDIGREKSGVLSSYLDDLWESGFIEKDCFFNLSTGKTGRFCHYRLKDNYVRFYLKYIEPRHDSIVKGLNPDSTLSTIINWNAIKGLQFENMVLGNLRPLCDMLEIQTDNVISAGPYFQKRTNRQKACQIDLLIVTQHSLYICEMKFRGKTEASVIEEVIGKVNKLRIPKAKSIRPVLIYDGELSPSVSRSDYFDRIVDISVLLNDPN